MPYLSTLSDIRSPDLKAKVRDMQVIYPHTSIDDCMAALASSECDKNDALTLMAEYYKYCAQSDEEECFTTSPSPPTNDAATMSQTGEMEANRSSTKTPVKPVDKRVSLLMRDHGFTRSEAEAAIVRDMDGQRTGLLARTPAVQPTRKQAQYALPKIKPTPRYSPFLECTVVSGAGGPHTTPRTAGQVSLNPAIPFTKVATKPKTLDRPRYHGLPVPSHSSLLDSAAPTSKLLKQEAIGNLRTDGVNEATAQAATAYKKNDIAKAANPGVEWDVVS